MAHLGVFRYPSSGSAAGSNASVGINGATAPIYSTELGIVDGSGNLQGVSSANPVPVSAAALPLPAGAATAANQVTQETTLTAIQANQTNGTQVVSVNNFPSSQPISGTVAVSNFPATQPVSAASLPLPTGAATAANQVTQETTLTAIQANQTNGTQVVSVNNFPSTQPVSGSISVSNFPATQPVSATALPLPTGASTSANQTTANNSLAAIATNTTGASTAANQTTANNSLAAIATNTTNSGTPAITATKGTLTDNSGTTSATPSTATTLMASNSSRKYLLVQNVSTTATIWINFTTTAVANEPSIQLAPGQSLVMESTFVSTEAVSVISTVASVPYMAKQA